MNKQAAPSDSRNRFIVSHKRSERLVSPSNISLVNEPNRDLKPEIQKLQTQNNNLKTQVTKLKHQLIQSQKEYLRVKKQLGYMNEQSDKHKQNKQDLEHKPQHYHTNNPAVVLPAMIKEYVQEYELLKNERNKINDELSLVVESSHIMKLLQDMVYSAINEKNSEEIASLVRARDEERDRFIMRVESYANRVRDQKPLPEINWNSLVEDINTCYLAHEALRMWDEQQKNCAKEYVEIAQVRIKTKSILNKLDNELREKEKLLRQKSREKRKAEIDIEELEDDNASAEEIDAAKKSLARIKAHIFTLTSEIEVIRGEIADVSSPDYPERAYQFDVSSDESCLKSISKKISKIEIANEEEQLCVICMEQERSHACIPCGHRVLCSICIDYIHSECPICRCHVEKFIAIYNS
jgi:chromosome segregation ATPase